MVRAYLPLNPARWRGGTPGSPLPTLYCTLGSCFSGAHETFICARNIHRKISALMGKSIAYQSTIAIEVTECKCVNATLHRKRDFILLPSGLKSGKLLGCKLFTETVSSFVFHFFLLQPQNRTNHVCQLPSNKGLRGSPCALFSVSSKGFEGLRVRRCLIDRRWVRASRLRTSMVGCAWQKPAFLYTPPPPLLMPAFQLQETLETGIAAWCEAQQPAIGPRGRARCRAVTHRVTRGAEDCSVQPSAWFPVKESAGREGACYRMANLTHRIVLLAECNSTYRHCMRGMPPPLFR